jgi:hypothetical protein
MPLSVFLMSLQFLDLLSQFFFFKCLYYLNFWPYEQFLRGVHLHIFIIKGGVVIIKEKKKNTHTHTHACVCVCDLMVACLNLSRSPINAPDSDVRQFVL